MLHIQEQRTSRDHSSLLRSPRYQYRRKGRKTGRADGLEAGSGKGVNAGVDVRCFKSPTELRNANLLSIDEAGHIEALAVSEYNSGHRRGHGTSGQKQRESKYEPLHDCTSLIGAPWYVCRGSRTKVFPLLGLQSLSPTKEYSTQVKSAEVVTVKSDSPWVASSLSPDGRNQFVSMDWSSGGFEIDPSVYTYVEVYGTGSIDVEEGGVATHGDSGYVKAVLR
jgi:hypothetical protein